jgi:uracil-DNA glycosylase family 4
MPYSHADVDRAAALRSLFSQASRCQRCPRLANKHAILGPQNGALASPVMFIAEAPGRLGADKFGIPLHGDATGRNFEWLLANAGFLREDVFVSNAVLCNPLTPNGRNSSPRPIEIKNCSSYLRAQIELIKPAVLVTLGAVALKSVAMLHGLRLKLSVHHRHLIPLGHATLIPLFHPSPRVMNTRRSRTQQLRDFRLVKHVLALKGRTFAGVDPSRRAGPRP